MWCSSRSKLCLCWRFWLYASVYLSPPHGTLNPWIKTIVPAWIEYGGAFRNILLFCEQLSHQLATEPLWGGKLQVIVFVKLQHLLQQGNTVDLAKMEESVYETISGCPYTIWGKHMQLCMRAETTNMWEYLLVFIWHGLRGRDRAFSANTFPQDCI